MMMPQRHREVGHRGTDLPAFRTSSVLGGALSLHCTAPHPDLSPLPNSSLFGGRLRKETLLLASRSLSVAADGPRSPHLRSVRHLQACPHTGLCLPSRSRDGQACAAGPELLRAEAAASHLGEEGSTRRL